MAGLPAVNVALFTVPAVGVHPAPDTSSVAFAHKSFTGACPKELFKNRKEITRMIADLLNKYADLVLVSTVGLVFKVLGLIRVKNNTESPEMQSYKY
jgi:hypothetical protein